MGKNNQKITVHFFTKGNASCASSRQRAFLVADRLNALGVGAVVHTPPNEEMSETKWPRKLALILKTLNNLLEIKKHDIVYLQRTIYNKYFFGLIILYKIIFRRKIIFDFDDAIYLHSFFKTKTLTKLADVVIVGSHYLENWAKKYNKNVYIVPTSIDFSKYSEFSRRHNEILGRLVIGWIGGATYHYDNLKLLVPVFEKMLANEVGFKFLLVGAMRDKKVRELFQNIRGLETEFVDELNWSESGVVPQMIQRFDVGVMPLVDNEWNKGKCSFKAIEYMACGVPTVISAVGENNCLIQSGINGFLAEKTEDWVENLMKFSHRSELLVQLGAKAQETVENNYSFESNVPKLIEIINELCKK